MKNSHIKNLNRKPKPINCNQCGITNTTLRKYNNNYYCDLCYSKTIVNELTDIIKK